MIYSSRNGFRTCMCVRDARRQVKSEIKLSEYSPRRVLSGDNCNQDLVSSLPVRCTQTGKTENQIGFSILQKFFYPVIITLVFLNLHLNAALSEDISKHITVIARHGSLEHTPENTFAAFKKAVDLGVGGLEIDVRKTKDDQLILMHDDTIDRTTDGKGYVNELLYEEIKQYDAGAWKGEEFAGERVPLLADVLQFAKDQNIKIILNTKEHGIKEQVLSLIDEKGIIDLIYFSGTLETVRNEDPDIQGTKLIFVPAKELTHDVINFIHEKYNHVGTRIIDSDNRDKMRKRMIEGVDVLLTNYPSVALDLLHYEKKKGQENDLNGDNTVSIEETEYNEPVNVLINSMTQESPDRSRMAALVLSTIPNEISLPILTDLLIYRKKLTNFGKIKNIFSSFMQSNDETIHTITIRKNAAWALGLTRDKTATRLLLSQLETQNSDLKREIILALKKISDKETVPFLNAIVLNDEDPFVRYDAARALGEIRDSDSVYTLIKALENDRNWMVKAGCACALGRIGNNKAVSALKSLLITDAEAEASWARKTAAWALAEIGEGATESLVSALRDNEKSTRRRASWALIQIGEPAIPHLMRSLRDTNKFARLRSAIVLGWIGSEKAVTSLSWTLQDDNLAVRKTAAWALGKIGGAEAKTLLEKIPSDEDKDVLEYAREAIQRISL
ncbi:MAG: HEAT repeat domain-containing protein [Candidatus Scalindua sp.]|nr:HEAT repeat domain-containing protein [Candidatus Scalindua sp.]